MRLAATAAAVVVVFLAGCSATAPAATNDPTALPSSTASAAPSTAVESIYYPVALGNTWVYSIDYGTGATVTDTEVMTAIVPEGEGRRVTISRTFVWDDGSQPDLIDSVDYVFAADGSLVVPFQSLPSAGGTTVTVQSGTMQWPSTAEFEAGAVKTGTIQATVESAGVSYAETIDFAISGAGTDDVTVPAGSYSARRLAQSLVVSLPDLGVSGLAIDATTWLADGVGPVRTEVPDASGGPTITQVLVSFAPGA